MTSITFEVNYSYDGGQQKPCQACVTLSMPTDTESLLVAELRDWNTKIFGDYLTEDWGEFRHDCRLAVHTVEAVSWKELDELVIKLQESTMATLREIAERNRKMLEAMPPDEFTSVTL